MMTELLSSPLFGIVLTLVTFRVAELLYRRSRLVLFNPVLVSSCVIIAVLKLSHISYADYSNGGNLLLFLLGPSVVALALPLWQRREQVLKRKLPILVGVCAGALASIVSAAGTAWMLGASPEVVSSLVPKSVTTPIAIGISAKIGGIVPLTAALVILTGCIGAIWGPEFCRLIGIRKPTSIGLAIGTASHGIGTARALEEDRLIGAVSGLAIGLNGLATAVFVPLLWLLLGWN
jgi:predicted murein hydrolase (TIGR00659 family)